MAHGEVFYKSPEFFVALSFFVAIAMVAKPVCKVVGSMLRSRIDGIIKRIQDAMKLKDDAQSLLIEYERKLVSAEKEAKDILTKAEKQVEFVKNEALAKLEKDILHKEKEMEQRLKVYEEKSLSLIKNQTADIVMSKVKNLILSDVDLTKHKKLIDESISKI